MQGEGSAPSVSQNRGGRGKRPPPHSTDNPESAKRAKAPEKEAKSAIVQLFQQMSSELDARNEKREQVIKVSRDITRFSKKVISLLQRATAPLSRPALLEQAALDLKTVHGLFAAVQQQLGPDPADYFLHDRAFSPGVQEYVEAVCFWHYIKSGKLGSKQEAEQEIAASNHGQRFPISDTDFLLGVCDSTGELMRFATNCATTGDRKESLNICQFLRDLYGQLQTLRSPHWEFGKKLAVMVDSLRKVELVCYKVQIRGAEYPEHMLSGLALVALDNFDDDRGAGGDAGDQEPQDAD